jgi:glycosyltransferase involved in cell wall biosynthesis
VKVLVAHNRYRSELPSGENVVVDFEIDALREAGVEVVPYLRSSDEIEAMSPLGKLAVPARPVHSREAVADVARLIAEHRPDVLHLHNPFPLISWSVVRTAHEHGVPVVVTVHNHRHSCMRGSYFRGGEPCTLCRGRALPWPGVQHGCYRDSRLQSVPMAAAFLAHRRDQRAVDRYVALTQTLADSLLGSGLVSPGQVVVRANSVRDPGPPAGLGAGLVFVGRLSTEKGVPLLLAAWARARKPFGTLTMVGDGPESAAAQAAARRPGSGVVAVGPTDAAGVSAALAAAAVVVVPSVSPEGLPLVVLEAFAHGRPVLATGGGGLTDVVDEAVGWLSAPTEPELADTMTRAAGDDVAARGRAARTVYERRFAPGPVMRTQVEIYRSVVAERSGSRP